MFDRIVGHFPDISNQSQCSIVKQTEIKPFDNQIICTSVEKFIKKGKSSSKCIKSVKNDKYCILCAHFFKTNTFVIYIFFF